MKHNKAKLLVLSVLASLCVGVGVATWRSSPSFSSSVTANADSYGDVFFEELSSFKMDGAAVRVSGNASGLRFTSSISKTEYDALVSDGYQITMGMLIIPSNKLNGELSLDNTTDPIANIPKKDDVGLVTVNDRYEFRAVQLGFPEAYYGMDMLARGYLTISDGAHTKTFYTDESNRNIAYVAYKATNEEGSPWYNSDNAILNNYIGNRVFYKLTLPEGISCAYDYAYEGQTVEITLSENITNVDFGNNTFTQTESGYTFTIGDTDLTVDSFTATVRLPQTVDIDLSKDGRASQLPFDLKGNVSSVTEGFSYENGVLSTTKDYGIYDVSLTTDAGYTYQFEVHAITQVIDTVEELDAFARTIQGKGDGVAWDTSLQLGVRSGYFVLGANIDATGLEINNDQAAFNGIFDGRGYAISGATYSTKLLNANSTHRSGGVFGEIQKDSVVKNLALTNSRIYCHPYTNMSIMTGGYDTYGTVQNCYVEIISADSNTAGFTLNQTYAITCSLYGTLSNVVVKTVSGINQNVSQYALGTDAHIFNVYVFGGGNSNVSWVGNDASTNDISISNVSSMTEEQFASFDKAVWGLKNGKPYFKNIALETGKNLDICLKAEDKSFGSRYIRLQQDLGLHAGVVSSVSDSFGNEIPFAVADGSLVLSPVQAGEQTIYITLDGVRYAFQATVITQVIDTAEELATFANGEKTGYFVLGKNIDASGTGFSKSSEKFSGTFDGRGHTISGAYITNGGLFGNIAVGATVKNLAFVNTEYGYSNSGSAFGKDNYGTIDNCYIEVVKQGYDTNGTLQTYCALSAFADSNYGTISNCVSVLPDFETEAHKAVCQYNYGLVKNVYCMGTEIQTTYTIPDQGTEENIVLVTTLTEEQFASLDSNIWTLQSGCPSFALSHVSADWTYTDLATVDFELGTTLSLSGVNLNDVTHIWDENRKAVDELVPTTAGESAFYYLLAGETLYGVRVLAVTQVIDTAEELATFANGEKTGYFVLGKNIDASGTGFSKSSEKFSGTFDGRGHTISGAYITNGGLFGNIAVGATVKNLAFVNTEYGYSNSGSAFGKDNYGTIDNCYIEVVKQGYDTNGTLQTYCALSAFADSNYGTISNCVSVLPDFETEAHKAVCQYNYGLVKNVYCMGAEIQTTYTIPDQGTEENIVLVTNQTGALPALSETGFDSMYWEMSVGNRPQFKGVSYSLVENGVADYSILYDGDSTISTEAANELHQYFLAATGVSLPLLEKEVYAQLQTTHYISVGYTYHMENHTGLWKMMGSGTTANDEMSLGTSGYIIDVVEGNVYITGFYKGSQPHGTLNGVYAWLEQQFGFKAYADECYDIDTGCTTERLEEIHSVVRADVPAIIGGNSDSYGNTALGYYAMNGANGLVAGAFGENIHPFHNFLDFLPQSQTQNFASNPNGVSVDKDYGTLLGTAEKDSFSDGSVYYFDNQYGNRNVYDLCLAQKEDEVIPLLLERMATLIDTPNERHNKYIAFSHEDGSFWCPHCRKKYESGNTGYATENEYITAIYTKFMIRLANAMAKDNRFKNVSLIMADYGLANKLPAMKDENGNYVIDSGIQAYMTQNGLTLPKNLVVAYSFNLVNNYEGEEDLTVARDAIARWKTITNRFYLWTYIENYENYFAPFDGLEQIQTSMKFAKECGAEVYFPQGMANIGTISIDWGALENYVISKLAWNVDVNVNTLIDEFFDGYYGAATTQMQKLYAMYKAKMKQLGMDYGFGSAYNLLKKENISYVSTTCWSESELNTFLDQIKEAYTALDNDTALDESTRATLKNRVSVEELTFKYLYIKLYLNDAKGYYDASNTTELKNNFIAECKSLGVMSFAESKGIDQIFN